MRDEGIKEAVKRLSPQMSLGDKDVGVLINLAQDYLSQGELKSFEDLLMEEHTKQYIGTKDCMVDDFNNWVQDLGVDELIDYGNKFSYQHKLIMLKREKELAERIEGIPHIIFEVTNNSKASSPEGLRMDIFTAIKEHLKGEKL